MRELGFDENCAEWARQVEKFSYLADIEQSIQIRQEDLATDPEEVFRRIQSFLGVVYDDGPQDFAKFTLVHPLNKKTQVGVDVGAVLKVRSPAYHDWTADQKSIFKDKCSEAMHETGYEIPF